MVNRDIIVEIACVFSPVAVPIVGAMGVVGPLMFVHLVPLNTCTSPLVAQSLHHTIKAVAGDEMASRCAAVIRGGKKPLVVDATSNCADALGVVVPIPVWAKELAERASSIMKIIFSFY